MKNTMGMIFVNENGADVIDRNGKFVKCIKADEVKEFECMGYKVKKVNSFRTMEEFRKNMQKEKARVLAKRGLSIA